MNIEFHPEALSEYLAAVEFYEDRRDGLGTRFRNQIETSLTQIADNPRRGWPHEAGTRLQRVYKFPYGIIYFVEGERLWIVAIAHFSRRPGYWHSRLS